jgi:hypothetical protein
MTGLVVCQECRKLSKTKGKERKVKQDIEIRLHPNNFNRDSGFMLSQAWHSLINVLEKVEQHSDERVQRGHRSRTEETPG